METKTAFLADRLQEVLLDGRWIANTNFREQIQSVDWVQATRQFENLNTIAKLTFHINYYLEGLLDAFATGELTIRDKYSFDLPPIQSADDWEKLVDTFLSNSQKFVDYVRSMDDCLLDAPFIDEKYGNYFRNIQGVIEHSYYHLGQVSLLRKLIQTTNL